jgi:hypothetical protein
MARFVGGRASQHRHTDELRWRCGRLAAHLAPLGHPAQGCGPAAGRTERLSTKTETCWIESRPADGSRGDVGSPGMAVVPCRMGRRAGQRSCTWLRRNRERTGAARKATCVGATSRCSAAVPPQWRTAAHGADRMRLVKCAAAPDGGGHAPELPDCASLLHRVPAAQGRCARCPARGAELARGCAAVSHAQAGRIFGFHRRGRSSCFHSTSSRSQR